MPASRAKGRFVNYGKVKNVPSSPATPLPTPWSSGYTYGLPSDQTESSRKRAMTEELLYDDDEPDSSSLASGK